MFKKKGKKQYSVAEKYAYHEKRAKDSRVGEGKRIYSDNWLSGFHDWHAEKNIPVLQKEMNQLRKAGGDMWGKTTRAIYYGDLNGMKAQLTSAGRSLFLNKDREKSK